MKPVVSVVLVSDYASAEAHAWDDFRVTLASLSKQDFDEPAEFLLVESHHLVNRIPPDLLSILPSLKIILSSSKSSYALKNDGARAASADIVALLDADCIPDTDWLRRLVTVMRQFPEADVVSGRTLYDGDRLIQRAEALLTRSYQDLGHTARTRHIATNNAAYKRAVLLAHPLPNTESFASKVQAEAILQAGGHLVCEPCMRVVHAFEGWKMERDARRQNGYATIMIRRRYPQMSYAFVMRLGYLAIPGLVVARMLKRWWKCLRLHRQYGVAWYELPVAIGLAPVVGALEVRGMIDAMRNRNIKQTKYR